MCYGDGGQEGCRKGSGYAWNDGGFYTEFTKLENFFSSSSKDEWISCIFIFVGWLLVFLRVCVCVFLDGWRLFDIDKYIKVVMKPVIVVAAVIYERRIE